MICGISFVVDNAFISEATACLRLVNHGLKEKIVVAIVCNSFLKDEYKDPDWKRGIPTKWLKDEWRGTVEVIQKFITCDFHFTRATIYLLRFLGHLAWVKDLNLVHFLHKSLIRMSHKIKAKPSLQHWHFFHKGLIKIIVSHYLGKVSRTWEEFIRTEGFEGMNISRVKGHPPKKPWKSSTNNEPSPMAKHFPKPTSVTFRGKAQSQASTVSKRVTPNFETIAPSSKPSSFRRVMRSQGNKFSSRLEPSSTGIKEQRYRWKKRVRVLNESVSRPNHEDPVSVSKKVKKIGKPILGSPSNSGPSSLGKKENTKIGNEQTEKKIFPQSVIVHEIHSEAKNDGDIPMSFKEKP